MRQSTPRASDSSFGCEGDWVALVSTIVGTPLLLRIATASVWTPKRGGSRCASRAEWWIARRPSAQAPNRPRRGCVGFAVAMHTD